MLSQNCAKSSVVPTRLNSNLRRGQSPSPVLLDHVKIWQVSANKSSLDAANDKIVFLTCLKNCLRPNTKSLVEISNTAHKL